MPCGVGLSPYIMWGWMTRSGSMRLIKGFKIGGLQQKVFNLLLIFIVALVGAYAAVSFHQQRNLSQVVKKANQGQQESIVTVSEETMATILSRSMTRSTALQAYIADDLFGEVRSDISTLQAFATELFNHRDSFAPHPVAPSNRANDGIPSAQLMHEPGVDPDSSEDLGLVGNMSEIMLAMFSNSEKLSSCFVGTTDGNIVFVNDRAGSYVTEDGGAFTFPVRRRPWFTQAAEARKLIFTGVEMDAFTGTPGLVCAAPVYHDGELVAVVGADIFLNSISNYVENTTADGGFLCVVNQDGNVLFSPKKSGIFKPELSGSAQDLRKSENADLAQFVTRALRENTGLETVSVDGTEYYMTGAPMPTVGWTVISVIEKEITHQPTMAMLERYDQINAEAMTAYEQGAGDSVRTSLVLTLIIIALALVGALAMAGRMVKPLEHMTKRINTLGGSDTTFEMEDVYRTDDEIEVLAQAFATLSKRTREYITQITQITAEKERIGTELALATRIQADMLPNIFPAFPDRPEFDIYATMDPAKEVGGDFYDFFLVDEDHLCMVMADVSGKGVPAALFMMGSKILMKNFAMTGKSPAEILESANESICANNREGMFVTVWLGILELSTGKLTAANAGHEYPVLMEAGGKFALVKDKHGFVIGGMEGLKFKEYELLLKPGSKLFIYTDGVPEATDANGELFGTDRMLDALNTDTTAIPEQILKNVRSAVDGFVKEAEQFDDLTMLGMEYRGGAGND